MPPSDQPSTPTVPRGADPERTTVHPDPARPPGRTEPAGARYRVLRPHARGGLGAVFVALDTELRREVALKEIQEPFADDADSRARFVREAEVTGNLEHPGIVPVYSLGAHADGRPFYAMRFIRGETLGEAIERFHAAASGFESGARRVAFQQLLRRFVDVCNAVAYAHSRGVLHRDLKPGNVLLGPYGETLVVDWGLAKPLVRAEAGSGPAGADAAATGAGTILGTPIFMSPEQAEGRAEELGPHSDVYSLGATLYCLLTGRVPFPGTVTEVLERVRRSDFPAPRQAHPGVPAALEAVCLKAMALRPADRYASAQELAADIERWLADEPVGAYREPWPARARRWLRRRRTVVSAAVAALVVATLGSGLAAFLLSRAYDGERQARKLAEDNERQAERQRDRARRNFTRAREAVDRWLTRVSEELTDTPQAERLRRALLEDALAFHERFMKEEGSDPAVRLEAARAAERVGVLHWRLGRNDRAEQAYRTAITRLQRLAEEDPGEPLYRQELLDTFNYLGTLYFGQGRLAQADQAWQRAQTLLEGLPPAALNAAERRHTLAKLENNRANLLRSRGKLQEAEAAYRRAIALHAALARDFPREPDHRFDLVIHHDNLARLLAGRGRLTEAVAAGKEALRLAEGLVKEHPTHEPYRTARADAHFRLAIVAESGERPQDGEKDLRTALTQYEELAADFPLTARYPNIAGSTLNNLALRHRARGQLAEAHALLERALARQQQALALSPGNGKFLASLRTHYYNLLGVHLDRKDHAAAATTAAALVRAQPEHPGALAEAGAALAGCAALVSADATLPAARRTATARSHADEAVALLRRAVAAGFSDWEALVSEERWASLRGRADFDRLVGLLGDWVRQHTLAAARRRARARPGDPDLCSAVANALDEVGLWYRFLRRPADGVAVYERSLAVRRKCVRNHPGRDDLAVNLGGTHCNLAHLLSDGPDVPRALRHYARALALLEPLAAKEGRVGRTAGRFLRNALMGRGELYARLGKYAEAVAELDRAMKHCPAAEQEPVRWARVNALARLGDHARAVADADVLARGKALRPAEVYNLACYYALAAGAADRAGESAGAERHAARALDLLRRAQAERYFADPEAVTHMKKDPDLDALRKRPAFQEWLRALGGG
jgi:serine/threonine-protein kinase